MRFGRFTLAFPYFNTEGGGAGAPVVPPAAPAVTPPGGSGAPASGAPVVAPVPPVAPAAPAFTYKEDRSTWVPSHVVRERTDRAAKLERELELERNRVAALSGVKREVAPNPERDAIRNQMFEVAPELKELFDLKDKIKELTGLDLNEIKAIRENQTKAWTAQGNQVLQTLGTQVKAAYGGAELSPKAMRRIEHAFINEIATDQELHDRYEAGDMTVISDFVKDYIGSNLDPYRRSTQAAAAPGQLAARRLPRGGGGSVPLAPKPATLKPSDGDAYHKSAWERFNS